MCNEYEFQTKYQEYVEFMHDVDVGPPGPPDDSWLNRPSIRIGDLGPVLRAAGNGLEMVAMKFGFPPARPKSGPVFNFKSEGRHFDQSARCIIPATGFFEFTGDRYPKTRHRFSSTAWLLMGIAGLWRGGAAGAPPSFTMLTTGPGPDVAPIHDRQIVILPPQDWMAWIGLARPESELLKPLPAGTLRSDVVRKGDS